MRPSDSNEGPTVPLAAGDSAAGDLAGSSSSFGRSKARHWSSFINT
ncbi:hypothetical protein [Halorubrum sp. N11]